MLDHPTADRSFYEKMLTSHTRRHGEPDPQQRQNLRQLAEDLVEQLGVMVEYSTTARGRHPTTWTPSRQTASWSADTATSQVIRRFSTHPENDD